MKKIILFTVFVCSFCYGQKCYLDGALVASDGERGNAVGWAFSNDLKFAYPLITSDSEEYGFIEIKKISENRYKLDCDCEHEFEFNGKFVDDYEMGMVFSRMVEVECTKETVKLFEKLKK